MQAPAMSAVDTAIGVTSSKITIGLRLMAFPASFMVGIIEMVPAIVRPTATASMRLEAPGTDHERGDVQREPEE